MKPFVRGMILVLALTLYAPAYANPFKDYYRSNQVDDADVISGRSKPEVYSTQDAEADIRRANEEGYLVLGVSEFVGTIADRKQAVAFAKKLRANIVIINYRFIETVSGGTGVVMMPIIGGFGGTIGHAAPISFQRYQQTAYYLAKRNPDKIGFGLFLYPLTADQAREAGTNKGAYVFAVLRGSPAFDANFISGDIILSVAGQDISTPERWKQVRSDYAEHSVEVEILRNGERKTLKVDLPSAPAGTAK